MVQDGFYQVRIQTEKFTEVVGNTDEVEGRGQPVVRALVQGSIGFIEWKAKGYGPMGSSGNLRGASGSVVLIGERKYLLGPEIFQEGLATEEERNSRIREAGLSKLTSEEKRALGLTK